MGGPMAGQSRVLANDGDAQAQASSQSHSWNAEFDGCARAEYRPAQTPFAMGNRVIARLHRSNP